MERMSRGFRRSSVIDFSPDPDAHKTLKTYAKEFFHRKSQKGIIKTTIKTSKSTKWQKDKISHPLHKAIEKEILVENCIKCFEAIQMWMGDRQPATNEQEALKTVLNISLTHVPLRNEIICQIAKQCNGNSKKQSLLKGLQLLSVVVSCFPPMEKHLIAALNNFLAMVEAEHAQVQPVEISKLAAVIRTRLKRAVVTGPRKTLPSDKEIASMMEPVMPKPIFGVHLAEYMKWQAENIPEAGMRNNSSDSPLPHIMVVLGAAVEDLKGFETEGIFRLPGDTEAVEAFQDQLGHGDFTITTKDPHVIASVYKLWLRYLAEPLIPDELYSTCLAASGDPAACYKIVDGLPAHQKNVIHYLIKFLRRLAQPEIQAKTKMTKENIAVVFSPNVIRSQSDDPREIMKNSPLEQQFIKSLMQEEQ